MTLHASVTHPDLVTVVPDPDDVPIADVRKAFNGEFVKSFDASGLPEETLREVFYSLDLLSDMVKMEGFPTDRLLTTPDIINFGEEAATALTHRRHHPSLCRAGVAVNERTLEFIQEFMDYKYPQTIHKILRALRVPGITLTFDNEPVFLGISYNTDHPQFGIVTYQDSGKRVGTSIPFLLSRLEM